MNPAKGNIQQGSAFIQDEFELVPDRLYVTAGAKSGSIPSYTRAGWYIGLLAAALCVATAGKAFAQVPSDEYHVKAAFIFHFAQLVEWPADTQYESADSLTACTLGENPFRGALDETLAGKQIGKRTVRTRNLKTLQDRGGCNVLFISKGENKRLAAEMAELRNVSVLTVGEDDGFLESGGTIRFCMDGMKIRFDINRVATDGARLRVSAQLLLLARNVVGGNGR